MATIKIHNIENDEQIERELTLEEIAQIEVAQVIVEQIKNADETKAAAKLAVLEKLGLTEEEAQLLFA